MLAQLLRKEVECIDEPALVHMQDVYDHTLRVLELIESQRELLTGLLEGQLAVQSNQMNRVMKATSSWGAILIVVDLIAGIYGMNFDDMPELRWAFGYPFALGLMVVVTGILYLVFKRRGLVVDGRRPRVGVQRHPGDSFRREAGAAARCPTRLPAARSRSPAMIAPIDERLPRREFERVELPQRSEREDQHEHCTDHRRRTAHRGTG